MNSLKVSANTGMSGITAPAPGTDAASFAAQGFASKVQEATAELDQQQQAAAAQNRQAGAAKTQSTAAQDAAADKKLRQTCQDMEAVFLNLMMAEMRKSVPKNPLLGESNADDIMKSMLDTETTKSMAKAGGIGLADMLYRQLSREQKAVQKRPG